MRREEMTKTFTSEKEARNFTLKMNKEHPVIASDINKQDDTHVILHLIYEVYEDGDLR